MTKFEDNCEHCSKTILLESKDIKIITHMKKGELIRIKDYAVESRIRYKPWNKFHGYHSYKVDIFKLTKDFKVRGYTCPACGESCTLDFLTDHDIIEQVDVMKLKSEWTSYRNAYGEEW